MLSLAIAKSLRESVMLSDHERSGVAIVVAWRAGADGVRLAHHLGRELGGPPLGVQELRHPRRQQEQQAAERQAIETLDDPKLHGRPILFFGL